MTWVRIGLGVYVHSSSNASFFWSYVTLNCFVHSIVWCGRFDRALKVVRFIVEAVLAESIVVASSFVLANVEFIRPRLARLFCVLSGIFFRLSVSTVLSFTLYVHYLFLVSKGRSIMVDSSYNKPISYPYTYIIYHLFCRFWFILSPLEGTRSYFQHFFSPVSIYITYELKQGCGILFIIFFN